MALSLNPMIWKELVERTTEAYHSTPWRLLHGLGIDPTQCLSENVVSQQSAPDVPKCLCEPEISASIDSMVLK